MGLLTLVFFSRDYVENYIRKHGILELVVSILLNLMCAWTSRAECQDLIKVEGPISKEQISQYRSSEGREALGLVSAQSNIWGLYSNTWSCDVALSLTFRACRTAVGDAAVTNAQLLELVYLTHRYGTLRLLVWFIFLKKTQTQFPVSKRGEEG